MLVNFKTFIFGQFQERCGPTESAFASAAWTYQTPTRRHYHLQQVANQKHRAERLAALHGCWSAHSSKHERNYGLGMDALVSLCSWNTNGIMVLAWMLWSAHSSKHERNYGLGMDALVSALIETRAELRFGHGCFGSICSWNTNGNMV